MNLNKLITQYITYRLSLGEEFITNTCCLKAFCKKIGPNINIKCVNEKMINKYLYGDKNEITNAWFVRHNAVLGFYKYAYTRGFVKNIPLANNLPRKPSAFVPYIYSKNELKLLFKTAFHYQKYKIFISPHMIHLILFLTYALGLRISETLSITLGDIDIKSSVLTIQQSKFHKSRLVPFNHETKKMIMKYLQLTKNKNKTEKSYLFTGRGDKPFSMVTMQATFQRIRKKAGIKRNDDSSYQPRMHDLRHSFAVHRLTQWYQENKNVQELLPILSTYLGHTQISYTSVYLTMTDDLLNEAKNRFEKYAIGEKHE